MRTLIKNRLSLLQCLLVIFFLGFLPLAAAERISYVTFAPLIEKYGLRHERESLTGRELFSGNGYQVVLCNGMSTMVVNDKLIVLKQRVKSIKGMVAVSEHDMVRLERILKKTHDSSVASCLPIKKVVIDPGHGGKFRGTRGRNGLTEKQVVLDIALKLRDLLKAKGIKVIMTRETDQHLASNLNEDLNRRVAIANREHPDLFISIHANWFKKPSVRGFEIYYSNNKPAPNYRQLMKSKMGSNGPLSSDIAKVLAYALKDEYKKQTLDLAKEIQKSFKPLTLDRGIREKSFRVIKGTQCPSILLEVEYMSNKEGCQDLGRDSYRARVSEKICQGILNFGRKIGSPR